MEERKLELVYVLSAESTYVDKTRKNERLNLWYAQLGHISYYKLKVMMNKSILRGLPQFNIRLDKLCTGANMARLTNSHMRSRSLKQYNNKVGIF